MVSGRRLTRPQIRLVVSSEAGLWGLPATDRRHPPVVAGGPRLQRPLLPSGAAGGKNDPAAG